MLMIKYVALASKPANNFARNAGTVTQIAKSNGTQQHSMTGSPLMSPVRASRAGGYENNNNKNPGVFETKTVQNRIKNMAINIS